MTTEAEREAALELAERTLRGDLVRLRIIAGLTHKDVAQAMGVDKAAVRRIEEGADIHLSTLRRYCLAIGAVVEHHVDDGAPAEDAEPAVEAEAPRAFVVGAPEGDKREPEWADAEHATAYLRSGFGFRGAIEDAVESVQRVLYYSASALAFLRAEAQHPAPPIHAEGEQGSEEER